MEQAAGTPPKQRKTYAEDALVGTEMGGYRVREKIGQGGMGSVYIAEQLSLHRDVAFKVLSEKFTSDCAFVDQFVNEARSAAALNHPNVVQVYDVGQRERPLLLLHGVRQRRLHRGAPRAKRRPGVARRPQLDDRRGQRAHLRPEARHPSPRRQARQPDARRGRQREAVRPGPGQEGRQRRHAGRRHHRDPGVHLAGGHPPQEGHRRPQRPLQPRLHLLPDPDRREPVPREDGEGHPDGAPQGAHPSCLREGARRAPRPRRRDLQAHAEGARGALRDAPGPPPGARQDPRPARPRGPRSEAGVPQAARSSRSSPSWSSPEAVWHSC